MRTKIGFDDRIERCPGCGEIDGCVCQPESDELESGELMSEEQRKWFKKGAFWQTHLPPDIQNEDDPRLTDR
jgi:hypothetical protein